MRKKFLEVGNLEVGKIVSTHGLKGGVKVKPWCDDGEFLCEFKELYLDSTGKRENKSFVRENA